MFGGYYLIIYADMVADLFHRGHVEFLKKIRSIYLDCYFIVGTHSDKDCTSYKRKPFFCMEDRAEILMSCKYIDKVIKNAPLKITKEFIDKHKINIVVHGTDMNDFLKNECYKIPIDLGIMKLVDYYEKISTTSIIDSIRKRITI